MENKNKNIKFNRTNPTQPNPSHHMTHMMKYQNLTGLSSCSENRETERNRERERERGSEIERVRQSKRKKMEIGRERERERVKRNGVNEWEREKETGTERGIWEGAVIKSMNNKFRSRAELLEK